ncbi:hypothetical protein GR212_08045 [Rhizobium lusitanum]|uniref:Uncharacterized protein n=1 Tax=Rhizobium lusitanum TaxID=293958 RepID=A0A6L9U5Q1_9HYPH|nr:hypothetical protein [Rhizobium lusitanum]NEI69520.1 hypothetical protein [Rhizobium lusitanum]
MKHLASIALTAALAVGSVLSASLPAASASFGNNPSPSSASNIILVQEHGTRGFPGDGRRTDWRDRHHDRRHWHERGWEGRRWDNGWRDGRRYHHRPHHGVIFEIRP